MRWEPILKAPTDEQVVANLVDYEQSRAAFSWAQARQELDGLPAGQGLNIAHEAIDRHAVGAPKLALRWLGKNGAVKDFDYDQLRRLTNRFANVLQKLGVGKGERVFALAGRVPELYIAVLGTLKKRSVFCPLFSAFGPEPIKARINLGAAKVLVTTGRFINAKSPRSVMRCLRSNMCC